MSAKQSRSIMTVDLFEDDKKEKARAKEPRTSAQQCQDLSIGLDEFYEDFPLPEEMKVGEGDGGQASSFICD